MSGLRLRGKVALVTGAGRRGGLGGAICARLAQEGASVVVSDVAGRRGALPADRIGNRTELDAVVATLRDSGARAVACELDVRDEAQAESAVALAVREFGGLDILVNNAGIGFMMEPLVDMPLERWNTVIGVNLTGAFLCTQHAARQMIQQGRGGRIINIASRAAYRGDSPKHWHYAASKAGMVAMTKSIARAYAAQGILAYAICPGFTMTGMADDYLASRGGDKLLADIPLGRVAMPEEVAEMVAFCALKAPPSMTGAVLDVNGASYVR